MAIENVKVSNLQRRMNHEARNYHFYPPALNLSSDSTVREPWYFVHVQVKLTLLRVAWRVYLLLRVVSQVARARRPSFICRSEEKKVSWESIQAQEQKTLTTIQRKARDPRNQRPQMPLQRGEGLLGVGIMAWYFTNPSPIVATD